MIGTEKLKARETSHLNLKATKIKLPIPGGLVNTTCHAQQSLQALCKNKKLSENKSLQLCFAWPVTTITAVFHLCCLCCSGFDCAAFDFVMVNVIFEACRIDVCAAFVHLYVCLSRSQCWREGWEATINRAEILDTDQDYTTAHAWVRSTCCRGRNHQNRALTTSYTVTPTDAESAVS